METSLSITPKRASLVIFYVLTFALSWGLWILLPGTLTGLLGAWAPSLVAIILTAVLYGRAALRALLGRVVRWRVGLLWYLFALLWPPVLSLMVTGISMLFGRAAPDFANPPVMSVYPVPPEVRGAGPLVLLPMVFVIQFFGSSLGEELGWRGFALPRFQSRWSPLVAGGIVGFIWGIWQIMHEWTPGQAVDALSLTWLVIGMTLNGVLYAWMFNNTRGSLIPALLLHTSQALTGLFLAGLPNPLFSIVLTALLVGAILMQDRAARMTHLPAST
ncbi:MAG: CPBP family intramembrane glutamic endopeptidase [Bacteroidota bacterium]